MKREGYFEFREKLERCATVGEIMDLPVPPTAYYGTKGTAGLTPARVVPAAPATPPPSSPTFSETMTCCRTGALLSR